MKTPKTEPKQVDVNSEKEATEAFTMWATELITMLTKEPAPAFVVGINTNPIESTTVLEPSEQIKSRAQTINEAFSKTDQLFFETVCPILKQAIECHKDDQKFRVNLSSLLGLVETQAVGALGITEFAEELAQAYVAAVQYTLAQIPKN